MARGGIDPGRPIIHKCYTRGMFCRGNSGNFLRGVVLPAMLSASVVLPGQENPAPRSAQSNSTRANAVERYNQGLALAQKGDLAAAQQAFQAALRANPKLPEAQSMLGWVL